MLGKNLWYEVSEIPLSWSQHTCTKAEVVVFLHRRDTKELEVGETL